MSWFYEFYCLESWSLFMLVENQENQLKIKVNSKIHAKRKKMATNSMSKYGFYA